MTIWRAIRIAGLDIAQNYRPQSGLELALQRTLNRPRRAIKNPAFAIEELNEVASLANHLVLKVIVNQWRGWCFDFLAETRGRYAALGRAY